MVYNFTKNFHKNFVRKFRRLDTQFNQKDKIVKSAKVEFYMLEVSNCYETLNWRSLYGNYTIGNLVDKNRHEISEIENF